MKTTRRSFLKWTAAAGAVTALPNGLWISRARGEAYRGLCVISVQAIGGYDPTFLTDPKSDSEINRITTAVGSAGNITYADMPADPASLEYTQDTPGEFTPYLRSNAEFFSKYASRLTVFNGVDTETNNHDVGQRAIWSGRSLVGYPALGALAASVLGPNLPLAFLSQGGYDNPAGLVPLARAGDANAMERVLRPNAISASDPESDLFHSTSVADRIERYRNERLAALAAASTLPAERRAMEDLQRARSGTQDLSTLTIPEDLVSVPGTFSGLGQMMQQSQIALASFAAGTTVAAGVTLGGFDTHSNHDRDQRRGLAMLLAGVDFIASEASRLGLGERVVIVVGSDFGRGPYYNASGTGAGKDHWPNTTVLVLLPPSLGSQWGNRQIGASDDAVRSLALDPATLAISSSGVKLTPATIHVGLRKLLGLDAAEATARFPLADDGLQLFT